MATRTIRICDMDEKSEGAEPCFFSIDDVHYKLDLAPANKKKLTDFLQAYIDKAHRVDAPRGGKRQPASSYVSGSAPATNGDVDPADVRAWALANDIPISDRGRIPEDIVLKFKEAKAAEIQAT